MRLYRTTRGIVIDENGHCFAVRCESWDELIRSDSLSRALQTTARGQELPGIDPATVLAPVVKQEVWAAGVTYYSSRSARIEESKDAGGGTFYDRVYAAERPELFFKSSGSRVIGPRGNVRIRADAKWSVPEPELTLLVNPAGTIVGFTIGNDMSSRDIEGENPLYLPQAKVYDGGCAIGPCILVSEGPLPASTSIALEVKRDGKVVFGGNTTTAELKRSPQDLVRFLFRETSFPDGVLLMTGTGIVPHDDFTLHHGDVIRIFIDGVGMLENTVA